MKSVAIGDDDPGNAPLSDTPAKGDPVQHDYPHLDTPNLPFIEPSKPSASKRDFKHISPKF